MRREHLSALAVACATATGAAASSVAGVVPIRITHSGRSKIPIDRRADTYTQVITNNISYGGYYASVSVGTPRQSQDVVLDTGSSDTWFLGKDSTPCSTSTCISTFDDSSSSTFTNLSKTFKIEYVDGSSVDGFYFTDDITVGGADITSLQMALASTADLTYGIMGIGFEGDEAAQTMYPNIIDKFYTEGLIGARAYSLYLDDLSSASGTILFGGIDSDKYTGDLIAVPIIKDSSAKNYTSFLVTLSSVTAVYSNGTVAENYTTSAEAVVLDSGTTLTYLPESMATSIISTFGGTYDSSAGYATTSCSTASGLSLSFQFGGADGPTINVPLSELLLQDGSTMTFGPGGGGSGGPGGGGAGGQASTCAFGVSMSSGTYLLGDTFLRSAYVVYDLDAKQVALAQANYNSTSTSITAIASGSTVPLVASTATSVMVSSGSGSGSANKSGAAAAGGVAAASVVSVVVGAIAGAMLILA